MAETKVEILDQNDDLITDTFPVPDRVDRGMVEKIADGLQLSVSQRQHLLLAISVAALSLDDLDGGGKQVSDTAISSQLDEIERHARRLAKAIKQQFNHRPVLPFTMDHIMMCLGEAEEAKPQSQGLMNWLAQASAQVPLIIRASKENKIHRTLGRSLDKVASAPEIYGAALPALWERLTGKKFGDENLTTIPDGPYNFVNGPFDRGDIEFVCDCSKAMGQPRLKPEAVVKNFQRACKDCLYPLLVEPWLSPKKE